MRSTLVLFGAAAFGAVTNAHIQMVMPPAINSKFDPQTPESKIDYSMTSPLLADGSNYPCKLYNTPDAYSTLSPVATLQAGSSVNVKLDGTAVHGGGSCQFSVSYDQGKTFAVIASIIGGCPIGLNFNVPIPANLPSADKATFAWTWFNLIGNREEYMNCAIVSVAGSSSSSYTGPTLFRANTFSDGTCITTEGQEVVFPNPGPSVQYLGSSTPGSPATQLGNCPFDQNADVTISPSGSGGPSQPKPEPSPSTTTTTTDKGVSFHASQTIKPTTSKPPALIVTRTSTSAAAATTTKVSSGHGHHGHHGTGSSGGSGNGPSSGNSSPSNGSTAGRAYVRCQGAQHFSLCDQDRCTFMGPVAAGTQCLDGAITWAKRRLARSGQVETSEHGSNLQRHRRHRRSHMTPRHE
ncbi:hypothetical protein OIO90_001394 [Microbotryomycetes sp. JL221]|nr:hypothetical protein OIO90_001394 [Microbotryomycetes sp. JL221]